NQHSLDLVDPKTMKVNFETDQWKKVVEMLTKFMLIPGYDVTNATVSKFNSAGNVAIASSYAACCGNTPGVAVPNFGVVSVPEFPELRGVGPQVFPNYWFMSSTSKHR